MRTNPVALNAVSSVVSLWNLTYWPLLQAAKLTAESFFHSLSDPGIVILFQPFTNKTKASFTAMYYFS